ncbi:MAG: prenyltransferase/squalene oxidase repeat-containing protein [Planctomycetota bacterium]
MAQNRLNRLLLLAAGVLAAGWLTGAAGSPGLRAADDNSPAAKPASDAQAVKDFVALTDKQDQACQHAAKWLAQHQNPDGSWDDHGANSTAMTGLAGMALLATGSTPNRGPYGVNVEKAVMFCLKHQDAQGMYIGHNDGRGMHGHGFSTSFMAQAYGMGLEPSLEDKVRDSLIKAVKLIAHAQSHNGGWYYQPDANADEGSVTVCEAQALRCCADVGIPVPDRTVRDGIGYMYKSQNADGTINYQIGMSGGTGSPALTAAGAVVFFSYGKYTQNDERARRTMDAVRRIFGAQGIANTGHQCYTDFYAAQAFHMASEEDYAKYYPRIRDFLVRSQSGDGSWQGDSAGQVYGTSLNLLVLAIPYNYLPMFQR